MIYILSGNDIKKRSLTLGKLTDNREVSRLSQAEISRNKIIEYAGSVNLFGNSPILVFENVIGGGEVNLGVKDLAIMQESLTTFIFLEEKLKAVDEKKYKKYASVENFDEKKERPLPKANTFAIADAFARRDKIATWILYLDAVEKGTEPESISGILFWKIKNMILTGNRLFTPNELKIQSSSIVSLYHEAHKGERDFGIGLEQFILTSLSK